MKVILLTDVPKVGNRYEVKEFKNGYAENVLLARGLAILATPHALSELENKKKKMQKEKEEEMKNFELLIASVNNKTINIKAKANEKGHLFKAISVSDIVKTIKETNGVEINEDSVIIKNVIKEIGEHTVVIKKGNKEGKCKIIVLAL